MANKMKKLVFPLIFLLCGGIFLVFLGYSFKKENIVEFYSLPANVSEAFLENQTSTMGKTTTLIFVGDIMLDRGVELMIKKNNDWKWPFLKIADELKKADILFGNLEGPISDKGTKVGSIYSFRSAPTTTEGLIYAGFDVLSLANNHAFDYGRGALEDTLARLLSAGIDCVGAGFSEKNTYSPVIKDVNGTKIAFFAYTNLGSPNWKAIGENTGIAFVDLKSIEEIKKIIQTAKKQADIVIVTLHSGAEYSTKPTQFQIDFSKAMIDAGANLAVNHHSHVVQPNEKYKDGWIFYGLGNFVFDQNFSKETMEGQIVKVLVENKKIKEVIPIKIKINQYYQPYLANNEI